MIVGGWKLLAIEINSKLKNAINARMLIVKIVENFFILAGEEVWIYGVENQCRKKEDGDAGENFYYAAFCFTDCVRFTAGNGYLDAAEDDYCDGNNAD